MNNVFQAGDRLEIDMSGCGYVSYKKKETYCGVVDKVYDNYILVNTGNYKITVLITEIACGDVKIKFLNGGFKSDYYSRIIK